jgi:serine/threonine-protein kinase
VVNRKLLFEFVDKAPLGVGGFARVWKARRRADGKIVAFKEPKREDDAIARLRREIEVQQTLAHPHVMPILDVDPDLRWFTMPLALGNLEQLRSRLDEDDLALIVDDIADALAVAHSNGLVHRDVTPRNILALSHDSGRGGRRWVIADWGLVRRPAGQTTNRLTRPHQGLGTEGFAAPETWRAGHEATAAADVYSLGQVVGWFLTGEEPAQNLQLLPAGKWARWRGFVRFCTQPDVDRRSDDMRAVQQRLRDVFGEPDIPPAVRARALADGLILGEAGDLIQLIRLALDHEGDAELYLDHLARVPSHEIEAWAKAAPAEAARSARRMAHHLIEADWGRRDRSYASTPLNFIHTVLRTLVASRRLDLAEDVAETFLAAEVHWNNGRQAARTQEWLATVDEPAGVVIARALRSVPGAIGYHQQPASWRPRSATLQALLTSP